MPLVAQGVVQNFHPYITVPTLEGGSQTMTQGPVASQEAIKMLGTNGGGFFNANSAHPYENPTPFSNFLQMVLIFAIPAALTYAFGTLVGDTKQGWVLFAAMSLLFLIGVCATYSAEQSGNPILSDAGLKTTPDAGQPGRIHIQHRRQVCRDRIEPDLHRLENAFQPGLRAPGAVRAWRPSAS